MRKEQEKTRDRLDDLTLENSQLIKKLLSKCEEFSQYRAEVESTNTKTVLSFKEKVWCVEVVVLTTLYPMPPACRDGEG